MAKKTLKKPVRKPGKKPLPPKTTPKRAPVPTKVVPGERKVKLKEAESAVVSMLVDESGSMEEVRDATIAGFNEYVATLKKGLKGQKVYFSALSFNGKTGVRELVVGAEMCDVERLQDYGYQPDDMTPLLDAIGKTIEVTDEVVITRKASKVIVVIQTDGFENVSKKFTRDKIKELVEARQLGGWQFVFLGAWLNAMTEAAAVGIHVANTMSYGKNAGHTRIVFGSAAANTSLCASGQSATMGFSVEQSMAAGEDATITRAKMKKTTGLLPPTV